MRVKRAIRLAFRASILAVLAFAFAPSGRADPKPSIGGLEAGPVTVTATPITSFNRTGSTTTRFGKLEFRGGLVLAAPGNKYFGGWSGLVLDADGKAFTSVSDGGVWMTGAITYTNGAPSAITDARIGPLLALDGKNLKRNRDRDAEAIALVSGSVRNGSVIVSYEQNNRLVRYDVTRDGFSTALSLLEKPKAAAGMRRNNGLEAMTVMKGGPFTGAVIALSERLYDSARNHTGWIWTASGPQAFHITNIGDFDVTDVASLEDGTLFVLERRFRWLEGVKMRIRRFSANAIQLGKTADGEILIDANLEYQIDNMEGLALTRGAKGETILTLISDDNFNHFLQRTILLQFALKDEARDSATAKTRPQR
jgi:hypothetical protein